MNRKLKYIASGMIVASMAWTVWSQESGEMVTKSEGKNVSINVQDTDMQSVLKLLAEQSGSNVVIGPDVAAAKLNLDLKDVSLTDALDVILKPHGYGYRYVGKTIVVDKLESLNSLSSVEPLESKVFVLKYLDASDVLESVQGLMSERGSCKALYVAKKQGWEFNQNSESGAAKLARVELDEKKAKTTSKTLIVTDIPSALTRIENVIAQIDLLPRQIEIRSYFVEMKDGALKDLGVDWKLNVKAGDITTGQINADGTTSVLPGGTFMGNNPLNFPDSDKTTVSGTEPYNAGAVVGLLHTGSNFDLDMLMHAVQQNGDVNILSAPRILAQDNQEATIIVGRKVPIISTKVSGQASNVSTELDYFERIGIQLNVIPQICDNGMINMIVHPSVTEQDGSVSASISTEDNSNPLTAYPIIQTREAETRLTVKDGETIAIGGLINDRKVDSEQKVPFLGDIPFLGRLFRRDTQYNEKVELVILLSASARSAEAALPADMDTRVEQSAKKLLAQWKAPVEPVEITTDMVNPVEEPAEAAVETP